MSDARGWADSKHLSGDVGQGASEELGSSGGFEEPAKPGSAGTTRVYLVRHGRTRLNAAGVLRGRLDPELDSVGTFQAKMLGDVIGRMNLELVVSSPLKRAVETATAIAERAGLEVEVDSRLIDRNYGPWAGKSREAVASQWGTLNAAPDMEPEPDVFARALDAVIDVSRRVPNGSAVVVSHDVVNRLLLPFLDPRLEDCGTVLQDTGCFNVIERRSTEWSVLSVNNAPGGHEPPATGDVHRGDRSGSTSDQPPEEVRHG